MPSYKIAIQRDHTLLGSGRHQSFSQRWADLLQEQGHIAHIVRANAPSFFDDIEGCDGFMWWFPQMPGRARGRKG